jgi:hypothetical protein
MSELDLAIIYWFYKEPEITKNHLEVIRRYNPNRKIFGLYGGDIKEASNYSAALENLLDDFWVYPETYGSKKYDKWIHGDLMLLDWYEKRGQNLIWDSVAITQWDMLLLDDIMNITPDIQTNQVFFSGYRTLDQEIENRWSWTKPDGKFRKEYLDFCSYVENKFGYMERLKCCLYIYEVLTRPFFDGYLSLPEKGLGMLEYKDPTLACILGLDIYEQDIGVYWRSAGQSTLQSPLNAMSVPIKTSLIKEELLKPDGWRLFHPYEKLWR